MQGELADANIHCNSSDTFPIALTSAVVIAKLWRLHRAAAVFVQFVNHYVQLMHV